MTPEQLDVIRARCEAATQGPWTRTRFDGDQWWVDYAVNDTDGYAVVVTWNDVRDTEADAELVAHAREDVPALLAEVDRLNALHREVAQMLASWLTPTQLAVAASRNPGLRRLLGPS